MFKYMSGSQIASLIVGIVFSILAIGSVILVSKYAKKINSFGKALALALVCPFVAYISWMFLILSYVGAFKKNELLNILVSFGIAVIIIATVVIIARTLHLKHFGEEENAIEEAPLQIIDVPKQEVKVEEKPVQKPEVKRVVKIIKREEVKTPEVNHADEKISDTYTLSDILQEKEEIKSQENTTIKKDEKNSLNDIEIESREEKKGKTLSQDEINDLEFEKYLDSFKKRKNDDDNN